MNNSIFDSLELTDGMSSIGSFFLRKYRNVLRSIGFENSHFTSLVNFSDLNDYSFVTDGFGYVSYFTIEGNAIPFTPFLEDNIKAEFSKSLGPFIKKGHKIIDTYCFYNDRVEQELKDKQKSRAITGKVLGLNPGFKDMALRSMISEDCFFETRLVAIFTPNIPSLNKNTVAAAAAVLPDIPLSPDAEMSLSQGKGESLMQSHVMMVNAYKDFLKNKKTNYSGALLTCPQALEMIARVADPKKEKTNINTIDSIDLSVTTSDYDLSDSQYDAVFGKDFTDYIHPIIPERFKRDIVRTGNRLSMSIIVERYSHVLVPYFALQRELGELNIPYRVKSIIGGNPIDHFRADYQFAAGQISTLFGLESQIRFRESFDTLESYAQREVPTMIQQVFTTWVDGDDIESESKLRANANELLSKIETWTDSTPNKAKIDWVSPLHSYFSSLPSFLSSTAPKIPIPLIDTITRMPAVRPTLPETDTSELLIMYPDGKLGFLDTQHGRKASITFTVGSSGNGKSVLYMKCRETMIHQKGNKDLPFEWNIEVGSSTKTSLDSLKVENPSLSNKIEFYDIRNRSPEKDVTTQHINIFSTPLGMRRMASGILDATLGLLADRLMGISGTDLPFAEAMLKDAYDAAVRRNVALSTCKKIQLRSFPGLKNVLRKTKFALINDEITDGSIDTIKYAGWEIVEHLIMVGEYALASKVHCKCELLIQDLRQAAAEPSFQTKWQDVKPGQNLAKLFVLTLTNLERSYPFISYPSTTNIYEKHIVTFELGNVVRKTASQTDLYNNRFWFGMVMQFTRSVIYTSEELLAEIKDIIDSDATHRPNENEVQVAMSKKRTEMLKNYCVNRAKFLANSNVKLHVDELQTFVPTINVNDSYAASILRPIIFEARKSKIEVAFSSQKPEHGAMFNTEATLIMILGFVSDEDARVCAEHFDIPLQEINYYIKKLKLEPKKGINAFIVLREVEGNYHQQYRQEVYIPIPSYEVWNYVNESDEKMVRSKLQTVLTYEDSLLVLSGALPEAGKSKEFQKIKLDVKEGGYLDDRADDNQQKMAEIVSEKVADKLIANANLYRDIGLRKIGAAMH